MIVRINGYVVWVGRRFVKMFLINFFEYKVNEIKVGQIWKGGNKLYVIFVVLMIDIYFLSNFF